MDMAKPKIRFKGYTDDWEQRKFSEFVKNVAVRNKAGVELECYAVTNDRGFISQKEAHDDFGYMAEVDTTAYNIVPPSSFAYNPARINVGSIGYYTGTENVIVSSLYEVFQTADYVDDRFMWHWFKSDHFPKWIERLQEGSVRLYFYYDKLIQCEMKMPSLEEQKKMGAFFDQLDCLITLHQRKCEETKKLKKYMLQKMFPQNGQTVPEIRFAGFTDAWEQRKFPEFVSFFNGLTYTPDDVQEMGTLVLRSSNVKNGEIIDADNVYVNDKVATSENVQVGDIIVVVRNGSRALIGKHAQIKASMPNTVIGAFMNGIRSEHSSFVNALLDTSAFENEIAKNMGATINQITGYMFSKMEFMVPSEEEQQQIGQFFSNLDHLITLHQHKCEQLQSMKKFMLQNMFV